MDLQSKYDPGYRVIRLRGYSSTMLDSTTVELSGSLAGPTPRAATGVHAHPAWFGAVMGTGALALALAAQSAHWAPRAFGAAAFTVLLLASVYALVLAPRYLARLGSRRALAAEMADPARGPMLATFPAGILVLALAWGRAGGFGVPAAAASGVALALLVLGVLVALGYGVAWTAILLRTTVAVEQVNGGWLIPPVMTLLVPLGVQPVMQRFPGAAADLGVVAFAFLGIGGLLFLALFGLLMMRLALHAPLPAALAPSLAIPLAPAPVLGLATLRLLQGAASHGVTTFGGIGAGLALSAVGLGFAAWWLAVVTIELGRLHRLGGLSTHPGWWGFVFPTGALALTLDALGSAIDSSVLVWLGGIVTGVLALVWAVVALRTVRDVVRP